MKYKVGDKVKIKTWKRLVKEFKLEHDHIAIPENEFNTMMEVDISKLGCDRNLTIKWIVSKSLYDYYKMEGIGWAWTDYMIEFLAGDHILPTLMENRFEILDL